MSTTSTTTTSVVHGHTLGDDPDLANHICFLIIARGDGTLFDDNSLQEEDIVELCAGMGQVHSNGVLQLLAMASVIAFFPSEGMLATACLITTATVIIIIIIYLIPITDYNYICHSICQCHFILFIGILDITKAYWLYCYTFVISIEQLLITMCYSFI